MPSQIEYKINPKPVDVYGYRVDEGNDVAFNWSGTIQVGTVLSVRPVLYNRRGTAVKRWELMVREMRTDKEVRVKAASSTLKLR